MEIFKPLDSLCAIADALSLRPLPIRRIVLDSSVERPLRAYIECYVQDKELGCLTSALETIKHVEVADVPPSRKALGTSTAKQLALAILEDDRVAARALADMIVNDPERAFDE